MTEAHARSDGRAKIPHKCDAGYRHDRFGFDSPYPVFQFHPIALLYLEMLLLRIVQIVLLALVSVHSVAIDTIRVNGRHFVNSKTSKKVNLDPGAFVPESNHGSSFGLKE